MTFDLEDFSARVRAFAASISPNGKTLAYVCNQSGVPQVWMAKIPKQGKLPFPKPITYHNDLRPNIWQPALKWIDNKRIIVTFDFRGDEQTRLKIINIESGLQTEIPWQEGNRDTFGALSQDRKTIYFASNRDNPKIIQLYSYSLPNAKVKRLVSSNRYPLHWLATTSKGQLFYQETLNTRYTKLWQYSPESKKSKLLFDEKDTVMDVISSLSAKQLLVHTNWQREFTGPAIFDLKSEKVEHLFKDHWDKTAYLSRDKKLMLVDTNQAGISKLKLYAFPGLKQRKNIKFPGGGMLSQASFHGKDNKILLGHLSSTQPLDFWLLPTSGRKPSQQLTDCYNSRVPQNKLVNPDIVSFDSGGEKVTGLFFLPTPKDYSGKKRPGKLPAIIWPHGGPQFQERPMQRPIFQYLLHKGYAILAPNPRGSTGFGKTWQSAIERKWGEADLPDMQAAIDFLKQHPKIDTSKLILMGGSYGGYMTLRTLTRIPKVFKVGIDIFGPSNLISFVNSVPEDWRALTDSLVGHPIKDKAQLQEQSPYFELDKIDCPLLIVQGALDPRVVKKESDQAVAALKKRKHPVEYLVFEDEGHGFFKHENEVKCFQTVADFIEARVST